VCKYVEMILSVKFQMVIEKKRAKDK
jgi:hypothetical protein